MTFRNFIDELELLVRSRYGVIVIDSWEFDRADEALRHVAAQLSLHFEAFGTGAQLTTDVLANELRDTRPLSRTMAERLEQLRNWARDRTVPADGSSPMRAVA